MAVSWFEALGCGGVQYALALVPLLASEPFIEIWLHPCGNLIHQHLYQSRLFRPALGPSSEEQTPRVASETFINPVGIVVPKLFPAFSGITDYHVAHGLPYAASVRRARSCATSPLSSPITSENSLRKMPILCISSTVSPVDR